MNLTIILPHIKLFFREDVFKALVAYVNLTRGTEQIVPPNFKFEDNCNQFKVVSEIIFLIRFELVGNIGYDLVIFHEDATKAMI